MTKRKRCPIFRTARGVQRWRGAAMRASGPISTERPGNAFRRRVSSAGEQTSFEGNCRPDRGRAAFTSIPGEGHDCRRRLCGACEARPLHRFHPARESFFNHPTKPPLRTTSRREVRGTIYVGDFNTIITSAWADGSGIVVKVLNHPLPRRSSARATGPPADGSHRIASRFPTPGKCRMSRGNRGPVISPKDKEDE